MKVFINVAVSIVRCVISVLVNSSSSSLLIRSYADIGLWIVVQFFSMMTELSVIIFGLAFGKCVLATCLCYITIIISSLAHYFRMILDIQILEWKYKWEQS